LILPALNLILHWRSHAAAVAIPAVYGTNWWQTGKQFNPVSAYLIISLRLSPF
jgi:hypothetical protein